MPRVASGTYATGTISSTAGSVLHRRCGREVSPRFRSRRAPSQSGPRRPSVWARRLGLTLEDIAAIGTANFESVLREERVTGAE